MRMQNKALLAAVALTMGVVGGAASASAQTAVEVSANVGVVSDYVFRGVSQTREDPALQGGVDLTTGGFYAGAWASTVDYGDDTDAEIDVYGGYRGETSGFAYDVGLIGYVYVDGPNSADYDNVEAKLAVSRAIGPVSAGVAFYYSPDFYGADKEALYSEATAAITPMAKLTLSGALGRQNLDVNADYTTWNLGATYALTDNVALDARYYDTNVDGPLSDDRFVGGLKFVY